MEIELNKLSSPRIFLVRMLVFLVLCTLLLVVLLLAPDARTQPFRQRTGLGRVTVAELIGR